MNIIDDTDSAIVYSGSWAAVTGSSRQYKSTVHSTTQNGASATIRFHGTQIIVYQTIPLGDGTAEIVNSNLDGKLASISRHSNPDTASYEDVWFDSGPINLGDHTLILSNGGGPSDTPFQLDRFRIAGNVLEPENVFNSPSASPTVSVTTTTATATVGVSSGSFSPSVGTGYTSILSSTSAITLSETQSRQSLRSEGDKTVTAIQYVTTNGGGNIATSATPTSTPERTASAKPNTHLGPIIGTVLGLLALILSLCFVLRLKRRQRQRRRSIDRLRPHGPTDVTPYDLESNIPRRGLTGTVPQELEKPFYRHQSSSNGDHAAGTTNGDVNSSPSEKNRDLFSKGSPSTSDIHASTPPITIEVASHCAISVACGARDNTLYRSHYGILVPLSDSNDIPPAYQSVRSRNSDPQPASGISQHSITPSFHYQ